MLPISLKVPHQPIGLNLVSFSPKAVLLYFDETQNANAKG